MGFGTPSFQKDLALKSPFVITGNVPKDFVWEHMIEALEMDGIS